MGFKLRKRQFYLFAPAILGEVALERMLNLLQLHPLWQALILLVVALFLTIWILKGNAIFRLSFYHSHREVEIHEIEATEEQLEKILGKSKPKVEGKILPIKNHTVKRKVRKKRFEL